jgi:hypothetical protein
MGYNKKNIYEKSVKLITSKNLFFVEDVISLLPCVKSTFYDLLPIGSNESNHIKELLDENRVNEKLILRKSFRKGPSSEKLALYKLICTDEERKSLSMNYQDFTSNGKELEGLTIKWGDGEIKI